MVDIALRDSSGAIVQKIVIKADGSQAEAESKKVEKSLTGSLIKSQLAAQALTKAFDLLVDQIKKGFQASLEFERTTIARGAALQAQGPGMERYTKLLEMQAGFLESISGISDETIRSMQTLAINVGVSADRVDDFVHAAISMANVTGRDARQALEQLAKTQSGLADETLKMIPGINQLTKEQLQAGEAIDIVNEKWGQFADLQTRGGLGELTKLSTAWDNFGEAIAKAASKTSLMKSATEDLTNALALSARFIESGDYGLAFASLFGAGAKGRAEMAAGLAREDAANIAAEKAQLAGDAPMQIQGIGVNVVSKDTRKKRKQSADAAYAAANEFLRAQEEAAGREQEIFQATLDDEARRYEEGLADRAKIYEANAQLILDLEKRKQDGIAEMQDANFRRDVEITNAQAQAQQDAYDKMASNAQNAFGFVLSTGMSALEQLVEGSEMSASEIGRSMLKGVGKWLIGRGQADILEGTARAFRSYGADATAYSLMGIGAAETAAGVAMIAGAAQMGGGGGGGSGAGAAVGGRTASWSSSADTGGGVVGQRATGSGSGGDRKITIVVDGNLSPAETGAWINKALKQAQNEGLLT